MNAALLVIDVQLGMFPEVDPVYEGNALLEQVKHLITRARSNAIPVIYVQHSEGVGEPLESGSSGWEVHPDIAPMEGDMVVQKTTPDSFHGTNLHQHLQDKGIHKLVLAGIQTDMCVDATCHGARNLGYDVVVAEDAHSTWPQGNLSATQIIDHYNETFRQLATVRPSAEVTF